MFECRFPPRCGLEWFVVSLFRQACAQEMLIEYSSACKDTLALPTVMGVKSPKER